MKKYSHYTQYTINFDDPEQADRDFRREAPSAGFTDTSDCPDCPDEKAARNLDYISFGSGSSGNSCYVGSSRGGVLIDAGVRLERVEEVLGQHGMSMADVKAILLTHDHADHIMHVYRIIRSHNHIRVYCTNRVMQGILKKHNIARRIRDYHVAIFKEIPFNILDFEITAFDVPHDGTDNMGFCIDYAGKRFVLATDLGAVTDRARFYMQSANYLVIEANYDLRMLLSGHYPEYLKARIQTPNGHMDNAHTAQFLRDIYTPALKYIFLCHLSLDNNTPEKALDAVRSALQARGLKVGTAQETLDDRASDVQLMALPRFDATRRFIFR